MNPDKEKIAKSFLRGKSTYDQQAWVQKKVGRKLIDMLDGYPEMRFDRVLEVGCCTGVMTAMFLGRHSVGRLFLNDLVPDFYQSVKSRFAGKNNDAITPLFGDIEELELPAELDLVLSSSTFQWLTDLSGFFARVAHALASRGYLAFSLFGPGTLSEFRQLTGVGLNYLPLNHVLALLKKDFTLQFADTERHRMFFVSPREVLRHLQATGVSGVRDFRWSSQSLRGFEDRYNRRYGSTSGVPVTYVTSYVIARKKG